MVGREEEVAIFEKIFESQQSELLLVTGRRRVGKTFLIRNAFSSFDFQVTGMANINTTTQLANFHIALNGYGASVDRPLVTSWLEAFTQLTALLESKKNDKKIARIYGLWMSTKSNQTRQRT